MTQLDPAPVPRPHAESLMVPERVITAPGGGVFRPAAPALPGPDDDRLIQAGEIVGTIGVDPAAISVLSPFTGFFMGLLAHAGERVRPGQAIAWVRVTA